MMNQNLERRLTIKIKYTKISLLKSAILIKICGGKLSLHRILEMSSNVSLLSRKYKLLPQLINPLLIKRQLINPFYPLLKIIIRLQSEVSWSSKVQYLLKPVRMIVSLSSPLSFTMIKSTLFTRHNPS